METAGMSSLLSVRTIGALLTGLALVVAMPSAGAKDKSVRVTEQQVLPASVGPNGADAACAVNRSVAAEASPALADGPGRSTVAVWQAAVGHGAGGEINTLSAGLDSTVGRLPSVGSCGAGGPGGELANAPALATGPDGTVWAATAVVGPARSSVTVSRLPRDGEWTTAVVSSFPGGNVSTSYLPATVAIAPADPPTMHVAYIRNHFPAGTVAVHRSMVVGGPWSDEHVMGAGATPVGYDFAEQLISLGGASLLAVSTEIDQVGMVGLTPDYLTYQDLTQAPIVHRVRRSTDGGKTWSLPEVALRLANGGVRDRDQGSTALRSLVRPSVAVGPDGTIRIAGESVAADAKSTQVLVATSTDAGRTWATRSAASVPGIALAASVAVDGTGELLTSWLHVLDNNLRSQWEFASSQDGVAWSAPTALSREFDLRALAPSYVGDQGALLGGKRGFTAATVVGTGDATDPTQVELTTVR